MKLLQLNNHYHLLGDYNTHESYNSRITKGSLFYKDDLKDIIEAEYSPASKVSRPILASTNLDYGTKVLFIDKASIESMLPKNIAIDELAKEYAKKEYGCLLGDYNIEKCFKAGYNSSDSDKKFTLEDMTNAVEEGINIVFDKSVSGRSIESEKEKYIKSITDKQNEWDAEIETDIVPDFESRGRDEDGQIFNGMRKEVPKINEKGFITILSIK